MKKKRFKINYFCPNLEYKIKMLMKKKKFKINYLCPNLEYIIKI